MADSVESRRACTDFGKRMETDSRSLLGKLVGIILQVDAYEAAGETQKRTRALHRWAELDELMRENAAAGVESLLLSDANLVSRYVEEFAAHGELAAMLHARRGRATESVGRKFPRWWLGGGLPRSGTIAERCGG